MASDEELKSNSDENFEWNVENEIHLFEAMIGHKPVGINKHFHMACISEKFENLIGKPVSSDVIWRHLDTMFDLAALDKKEALPFPNEQEDFSLPESEYLDLINEKIALKTEPLNEVKEMSKEMKLTSKVVKDSTPAKEAATKREKKTTDESESSNEDKPEKKEKFESENEGRKSKGNKEEKTVKTRAKKSLKEKKFEEETSQTPTSNSRKDEDNYSGSSKKEKQVVGKRNLRSRAEEAASNKSVTPPPGKRARRI